MVDNDPFAKGASKKLSVHIPAFFFLFGGGGGRQGNRKMKHRCEIACSPRGVLWFQMTGLIEWGQKPKPNFPWTKKLTTKKSHARFPSPKSLLEGKKSLVALYLVVLHTPQPLLWPLGEGRTPHMKVVGMLVISLRGVNFEFWCHLGCCGQNAIIFSHKGLV